tara:strand:+ start:40 stop:1611 length:1572 start_codon:yes stop_codon:yes gene_type:complete
MSDPTPRRVSVSINVADLEGLTISEPAGTVLQMSGEHAQVALDDGSSKWVAADAMWGEEDDGGEEDGGDVVGDLMASPAKGRAERKLQKAGMRASRRVSFLRKSNESVQMSDIEQAEYFLRQFAQHTDVKRTTVKAMLKDFIRYDKGKKGHLEENEAMMMLESRGDPTSFVDLRGKVRDIDLHQKRNLSFLEWCCAVFDKSWIELHQRTDLVMTPEILAEMEAMRREMAEAMAEAEAANERSLRAQSMRLKTDANAMKELMELQAKADALAADHATSAAADQVVVDAAKALQAAAEADLAAAKAAIADDTQRQANAIAGAAAAARAAQADDAAVKTKMALFKKLDEKTQMTHMTNEERIKFDLAKRKKKKAEKKKAKKAAKVAAKEEAKRLALKEVADATKAEEEAVVAAQKAEAARVEAEAVAAAEAAKQAAEDKEMDEERLKKEKLVEEAKKLDAAYKAKKAAEKAILDAEKKERKAERKKKRAKLAARAAMFESGGGKKVLKSKKSMSIVLSSQSEAPKY